MAFWLQEVAAPAAAEWYVLRRRWSVARGTYVTDARCSCGDPYCTAPGAHPAVPHWRYDTTTDAEVVRSWWRHQPAASVLLPTGALFDVLDAPEPQGREALQRLERIGVQLGPVAQTGEGRVLIWVAAGTRMGTGRTARGDRPHRDPRVYCHSTGGYVVAPPCLGATWINPPTLCWCLPDAGEVIHALETCAV
jgi:hypothetical protein